MADVSAYGLWNTNASTGLVMLRSSQHRSGLTVKIVALSATLALIPVLCVKIPGFSDAPSHMARHHILAAMSSGGPLSGYFVAQWQWIANLGEDIPASLLARALGGELATTVVTAIIAPLTIFGLAVLSRAAHGRVAASAAVAMPLVFHQAWMFGFLNYCLGTALALLAAAGIFARRPETVVGQTLLGLASLLVWTAHMASWVVLLILAAGNAIGSLRGLRDVVPEVRRHAPLLLPLVPLLLWRSDVGSSGLSFSYDEFVLTKVAIFIGVLRGTWMKIDIVLLIAVVAVAVLASRWAYPRRVERRLFIAGSLLLIAAVAAPDHLLSTSYADLRIAPVAIMVLILAIPPAHDPQRERIVCLLGIALFLTRLTSVTTCWAQRSPMLEQRLTMLDAVPRGGKLGYLYAKPTCDGWMLTPDEKLASYAVARREAFVNTLFMTENARIVAVREPGLRRWVSESQRLKVGCPGERLDAEFLRTSMVAMRHDRFDAIWISGVPWRVLPPMPDYSVARSLPGETMLVRR